MGPKKTGYDCAFVQLTNPDDCDKQNFPYHYTCALIVATNFRKLTHINIRMLLYSYYLGNRIHNSEYVLSDPYKALSEYSKQATSVFMQMQHDQTLHLWDFLNCGDIQDDTEVSSLGICSWKFIDF